MTGSHSCPLCTDTYDERGDLRVHLEVEHRKSELARYVLEGLDARTDPTVERYEPASPV